MSQWTAGQLCSKFMVVYPTNASWAPPRDLRVPSDLAQGMHSMKKTPCDWDTAFRPPWGPSPLACQTHTHTHTHTHTMPLMLLLEQGSFSQFTFVRYEPCSSWEKCCVFVHHLALHTQRKRPRWEWNPPMPVRRLGTWWLRPQALEFGWLDSSPTHCLSYLTLVTTLSTMSSCVTSKSHFLWASLGIIIPIL